MNDKRFIFIIIAVTIVVFGLGYLLVSNTGNAAQVEVSQNAKVEVGESTYDWGEVEMKDGNVDKTFSIKNSGTDELKLSNVITSCMCTTAILQLGNATSPMFGMHTKSSYVMSVPPGETANLKVIFDPAFHGPSGVGPISRQVTVTTNDKENPELTFSLTAVVNN